METVKDDICELKTNVYALVSEIHISKTVTYNLSKYIKTLEWKYHENENYWRCLEISGIPSVIKDNGLEVTILTYFQKLMSLLVLLMLKIAIALKNKYFPSNSYCETAKTPTLKTPTLLGLKYLVELLHISTKFCAGITNSYRLHSRNFG